MQPAAPLPEADLLLIKPPFPVPTAWAYKAWAACKKPERSAPKQFLGTIELHNDLELPVFEKYLLLPVLKNWLLDQPEVSAAMMSGSGSTVFAILHSNPKPLEDRLRTRFGEQMWTSACRLKVPEGQQAILP